MFPPVSPVSPDSQIFLHNKSSAKNKPFRCLETKGLSFRGTTLLHRQNSLPCALLRSLTESSASHYARRNLRFLGRTPRPVGSIALLPHTTRQLSENLVLLLFLFDVCIYSKLTPIVACFPVSVKMVWNFCCYRFCCRFFILHCPLQPWPLLPPLLSPVHRRVPVHILKSHRHIHRGRLSWSGDPCSNQTVRSWECPLR